ncbi:hypothetical protein PM10SUCC1_35840 [Propionigenium maris DSM 9537]|uniref:DNA-binding transcriptional regulator, FrmR family n=1 Tax=Propionigenium maris DSM 9537 TaxID=1123000 RepID=A0A9W6LQ64_9FUSO|nr:metal-sensitive transcriptional regulator [Propionigenium maris]GLI58070.1 hypothetical protein PM10SUCC1_35840 [Propionigenium maris DSM 9537]
MDKNDKNNTASYSQDKKKLINRLNRIEGQIRGIKKLIENDTYCDDILNQINSSKSALNGVSKIILKKHLGSCVANKIKNDDPEIIDEFIKTIEKIIK